MLTTTQFEEQCDRFSKEIKQARSASTYFRLLLRIWRLREAIWTESDPAFVNLRRARQLRDKNAETSLAAQCETMRQQTDRLTNLIVDIEDLTNDKYDIFELININWVVVPTGAMAYILYHNQAPFTLHTITANEEGTTPQFHLKDIPATLAAVNAHPEELCAVLYRNGCATTPITIRELPAVWSAWIAQEGQNR